MDPPGARSRIAYAITTWRSWTPAAVLLPSVPAGTYIEIFLSSKLFSRRDVRMRHGPRLSVLRGDRRASSRRRRVRLWLRHHGRHRAAGWQRVPRASPPRRGGLAVVALGEGGDRATRDASAAQVL